MKRYNIALLILAGLLVNACTKDFLELEPVTSIVEDNFYQTEDDAFKALVSVYDVLQWGSPENQNVPFEVVSEIASDECYGGGSNANDIPGIVDIDAFEMDPSYTGYQALWHKYYFGIYRANLFLQKIKGIEFKDPAVKARYIAEVKFLRADYYFDLVRLFGNVPLILQPLSPSEYDQKQAEPSKVYAQIAKDLYESINDLPETVPATETGRITKWAAESMMGRVFLYYTGYYSQSEIPVDENLTITKDTATRLINDVIDNGGFGLVPNFADLWKVENQNSIESVFEIQYTELSKWGDWFYRIGSEGNQAVVLWGIREPDAASPYAAGWSFGPVNPKLWDAYSDDDTRKRATIISIAEEFDANGWTYKEGFQNTGYFNKKFTPLKVNEATIGDSRLNYPNNYPVIRFADVLLMGAELNLETNLAKAQDCFDQVQKRAYGDSHVPPTLTPDQSGLDLIFHERYLELALEGHRYWDLLRRGINVAAAAIDEADNEYPFKVVFKPANKGLFPIPQSEIELTNGSLVQNEGY